MLYLLFVVFQSGRIFNNQQQQKGKPLNATRNKNRFNQTKLIR